MSNEKSKSLGCLRYIRDGKLPNYIRTINKLGGGFKYFSFTRITREMESNLTCAYFSKWVVQPPTSFVKGKVVCKMFQLTSVRSG